MTVYAIVGLEYEFNGPKIKDRLSLEFVEDPKLVEASKDEIRRSVHIPYIWLGLKFTEILLHGRRHKEWITASGEAFTRTRHQLAIPGHSRSGISRFCTPCSRTWWWEYDRMCGWLWSCGWWLPPNWWMPHGWCGMDEGQTDVTNPPMLLLDFLGLVLRLPKTTPVCSTYQLNCWLM